VTAPLRTGGQFLAENGFGAPPSVQLGFPEFPAENAQLQALRKLDPLAREVSWIEHLLTRAREAQVAGDASRAADELAAARKVIVESFRSRSPAGRWGAVAVLLAIIALAGILVWKFQRDQRRRSDATGDEIDTGGEDVDDLWGDDDDDDNEEEDEDVAA